MTSRGRFIGALFCALTLPLAFLVFTITCTQHVASTNGERQQQRQGHQQTFAHAEATDAPRQEVPNELRVAIEETCYRLERDETRTGEVGYLAPNPAQGWRARFDLDGLSIETHANGDEEARRLAMSLASYGYGEMVVAVERPEVMAAGNRIEYRRGSLVEWYVNERRGVEQGFTINEPPALAGARAQGEPLSLRLMIDGDLRAELSADGRSVGFVNAAGQPELSYDKLVAFDARGHNLSSRMRVEGSEVVLEVADAGASYPITIDPFVQTQKLIASDAAAGDHFGSAISLSGDTAIIGAQTDDHAGGTDAGSAYIFIRSGGVWTQQQKLMASDAATNNRFGYSVSVSGDTAVIGSIRAGNNEGQITGAAYVFTRSAGVWTQQQKLMAADGADEDHFGYSVSVSGDTTVISAFADDDGGDGSGSAYVFARSGGVWTQQQKLTAADSLEGDFFGRSVSLSGDTVIISAWADDNASGFAVGSAYIFMRSGGVWTQQQKLTAADATAGDFFGTAVSLSGDTAIIGAHADDHSAETDAGSAYIFIRSGGVWTQQQKLTASDAAAGDDFGFSVSVSGDTAVISSDDINDAGAVYVFTRSGGVWTQQQKLMASDASTNALFGSSVSLSGDTIIVCAADENNNGGVGAGSAYVFISATANAAPVVNAGPDQTATEDVAFNLTASFTDADASDNHTATINWGDGSPTEAANLQEPAGATPGTINASHVYLTPGVYTINVNVIDGDDASGSDTLQVTVGQCSPTNVALLTAGATATASSTVNANFPASAAIDGERKGMGWGTPTAGGWNDATRASFPDALEVTFAAPQPISEVAVYTLQNSFSSPLEPTEAMTFTAYGITAFEVQTWNGSQWVTVPGGLITGNDRVMRRFVFGSPITTDRIRVVVHSSADGLYSRIVEVEALSCTP